MTLLINVSGYSALRNFCLIFSISSAGKLATRVALFKSLMIAFLLYRFGTFDDQWTVNFLLTEILVHPVKSLEKGWRDSCKGLVKCI